MRIAYLYTLEDQQTRERSNTSFVSIRINSQRPTNRRILIWLARYFLSLSLSCVLLSSSDKFVQWYSLLSRVGGFAWAFIFLSLALFCSTDVHRCSSASFNVYFQRHESAADVSINSELKNKDNADVKVHVRAWRQLFDRNFPLERMRRCGTQNNGHPGGNAEFHLDVPTLPIWQNNSMPPPPPSHIQLLPTTINGHHIGNEQMDRKSIADSFLSLCHLCCHHLESNYFPSFIYPSTVQASSFNSNGTVYFTHAPPLMPTTPQTSQGPPNTLPSGPHFSQFHPGRTFDNSNRHSFHQPAHFQPSPPSLFQMPPPPLPSSMAPHLQAPAEDIAMELPPRFRRPKAHDQENKFSQPRPMSGDFDRFRNGHCPSSNYNLRPNNDHRAQPRPQSFYDFSSPSSSNNNNNNFTRPPNNTRYQRNTNNTSLPLSAYMNADDSTPSNDNGNRHQQWGTSYQKRRPANPPRAYQQDKHQFPLSLYDPRQYGFSTQSGKRTELSERANPNDIDLIEEWWEDNNTNTTELIGTDPVIEPVDSHPTTTVNDSGNSSLSTSINLKESTLDDEEENNLSTHDFISPPSDVSTTDSKSNSSLADREIFSPVRSSGVIIESLDKLQQQLKLEEALDEHLASADDQSSDKDHSLLLNNEVGVCLVWFADHCRRTFVPIISQTTTYDTAHFLQWAKDKFREELAGRLTAQVGWQWAWNDNFAQQKRLRRSSSHVDSIRMAFGTSRLLTEPNRCLSWCSRRSNNTMPWPPTKMTMTMIWSFPHRWARRTSSL